MVADSAKRSGDSMRTRRSFYTWVRPFSLNAIRSDFFVLDALDVVPRSDMASMAHPIFSLSTKPETRVLKYRHEDVVVEIHPSSKGLATIFDKDVLIYATSKLMHRKNGRGNRPGGAHTTHDCWCDEPQHRRHRLRAA